MPLSSFAQWLNTAFADFDYAILKFYHSLAESASAFFNPIAEFFSFIGDGSMFGFILAAVFILFAKTRKAGICMALSVGIGALFTNVAIKNFVARPRPYASGSSEFILWWQFVGEHSHSEYSFPSGHTTAAMAAMTAMCLCLCLENKKLRLISVPAALYVIIMGAARNYLLVHYPSDIIGGIAVGAVAAIAAYLLISFLFKGLEGNRDSKVCAFILDADIRNLKTKKASLLWVRIRDF